MRCSRLCDLAASSGEKTDCRDGEQPPLAPLVLLNVFFFFPGDYYVLHSEKNLCRVGIRQMIKYGAEVQLACELPRYHGRVKCGRCEKSLCPRG